jgi:hypothetical protein
MKRAKMTQLYRSPKGDTWFLGRDPATGSAFVRHEANIPSGGQVTDWTAAHSSTGREILNTKRCYV